MQFRVNSTTTTLNYIVTHNFQPNSKKDNSYKTSHCAKYNTQVIKQLWYKFSLQQMTA